MNTEEDNTLDNINALVQRAKHGGLCRQATVYSERGDHERALAILDQVLQADPDMVEVHYNRGLVFTYLGRMDEARSSFHRAIDLKPDYAEVYRLLTAIQKFKPDDSIVATMEGLYQHTGTNTHARMNLGFGLGKVYNDSGLYDRAAACYLEANRLNRKNVRYSEKEYTEFADYFTNIFTPEYFSRHAGTGVVDDTPIFIVGMPRSGTTLLEQILASHPEIDGVGEVPFISQLACQQGMARGANCLAWLEDPSAEALKNKGNEYLRKIRERSGMQARHITNKMVSNFWLVGFIRLILPNARIIHVRRNARDSCLSIFTNFFTGNVQYAYDLAELGRYYRLYASVMNHWNRVLPGFIYEITYEDLVEDPEGEVRRLLDHCRLPFDAQCLAFHESDRAVQTLSHAQVRKPLYKGSVGRWKSYEQMLQPLILALEGG